MQKIRCAVIGSGNIGTDLIYKLKRSEILEPVWMVGIDPDSEGLARARGLGLKTTHEGVDGLLAHVRDDRIKIAFDATSAYIHPENSGKLTASGVMMIDLTPAAIGPLCVPPVNLAEQAAKGAMNVNMISCAGQATIPMVYAVSRIQDVDYAEIVASLSSKSVGPGTRANLDEYVHTTSSAIAKVSGAKRGKALAIVNPAEPPMIMRNSIFCETAEKPNAERVTQSVLEMIGEVQKYVPGYKLINGPVFEDNRISIFLEVAGLGDYLPRYAGNLDIMTAAAMRTAEMFAEKIQAGTFKLVPQEVA